MEKRNVATTARVVDDGMDGVIATAAKCLAGVRESVKELSKVAQIAKESAKAAMEADEAEDAMASQEDAGN